MRQRKTASSDSGRAVSRRKFLGVTAGATAALSFGTFIRSGQGAASLRILTWSNTLNAMDDTLREQAKQYTKEKGVEVAFEFINQTDLPTKTAAAVESGAGPDIITTWSDGAHLHDKALIDVSDIAESLGSQLKGWTNIGRDIAFVGKTWKAVPWGIIPIAIVYRTDWCKEVGYDKFPDTYDEMLVLSKKLKDKGHPVGFALGRAIGDGNQSHYPMFWAFGGMEAKKDGKTVAINSPETAKAVDWRRRLFKEAETEDVLSWDDSSNNRAFLAEAVSVTGNAASIYWAEQKNAPQLARRDEPRAVAAGVGGPVRVFHCHGPRDLPVLQVPERGQGVHHLADAAQAVFSLDRRGRGADRRIGELLRGRPGVEEGSEAGGHPADPEVRPDARLPGSAVPPRGRGDGQVRDRQYVRPRVQGHVHGRDDQDRRKRAEGDLRQGVTLRQGGGGIHGLHRAR